jgi:signal transduction histidine kinase
MFSSVQVLLLSTGVLDALVAALVYMVFRRENDRSARLWVFGSLLMAAGMMLLVIRPHLPNVLAFAVTNFIMLYAMALYHDSFQSLARPDYKASWIPLWLCIGDGLLIWWLKAGGHQSLLSLTAAVAWSLMHLWMLISFARIRRDIRNPYFTVFQVLTALGLVVWLGRVYLAAGFGISMATDATLINLISLVSTHAVLLAQQIGYLVVRLTDEQSKKQKIQELSESVEKMWSERQTLLEARQQEREQLLRDVHDGFGSKLAAARMLAERGRLEANQFAEFLDEITADLHLVVDTLSHADITFEEALADLRYRLQRRMSAVPIHLHWDIALGGLPPQNSRAILSQLRVVQEALNNAMRHASPTNIRVSARFDRSIQELKISITDDGVGLPNNYRRGQGINNMLARAREIGGVLALRAASPGTEVLLSLPVREPAATPAL